jgi:hypothetical protein
MLSVSLIRVLGANEATPVSRTVTTQPYPTLDNLSELTVSSLARAEISLDAGEVHSH